MNYASGNKYTQGGLERWIAFTITRKVTVLMVLLSILILGIVAATKIPLEIFPSGYTGPNINIWIPWYGAPPRELLDKIITPLEEELSTIRGLKQIRSFARLGSGSVSLTFSQGMDMNVAYREVRDRVERAKVRFPEDVDRTYIFKEDISGIPIYVAALLIDSYIEDPYTLIEQQLVRPIQRLDGVANIRIDGLQQKEILIEVDREKAEAAGLNLYEMTLRLSNDNFTLASGYILEGGKKFLLRSDTRFRSIEEIQNRFLTPYLRLFHVANVKFAEPERRFVVRVNGKQAAALVVLKESKANTVDVCARISSLIETIKQSAKLQGVEVIPVFDQGSIIKTSLIQLIDAGCIGALLAAITLFFFLQRVNITFLVSLAMPLSLLATLVIIYFVGETLNILTIVGLFISAGMLLDNSIVVSENIFRHSQQTHSIQRACIVGTSEVTLAIVTSTLTTIIVFLPVALIEGEAQFFLIRLALPVGVSLTASLLIALVFIPLFAYLTLSYHSTSDNSKSLLYSLLKRLYENTFGVLNKLYAKLLRVGLYHRSEVAIIVCLVLILSWQFAFKKLQFVEQQEEDRIQFDIIIEASEEYGFNDMWEYFEKIEPLLKQLSKKYYIDAYLTMFRSGWGRIEGWLKRERPSHLTAKIVGKAVLDSLPRKPGMIFRFGLDTQSQQPKQQSTYLIELVGNDYEILEQVKQQIQPLIMKIPGVIGIRGTQEITPQELGLVLVQDQLEASGIQPDMVAGVIAYALRGASLPKYIHQGREIPIRLRFSAKDRASLDTLLSFRLPNSSKGTYIPIGSVVEPIKLRSPKNIIRSDRKFTQAIIVELDPQTSKKAISELLALQSKINLPEGVSFRRLATTQLNKELRNFIIAGCLSIVFIYLLMGTLFESVVLPLSILFTIPLAGIGMGWMHRLSGTDVDFLGAVGAILLAGIVVNNGIVLIDYVNRLRNQGTSRWEALSIAASRRFRPIMMTALTTIIGMIPLALSRPTDFGISYKSFALTLIGGLATSTLLTLIVIPVFYSIFDDLRVWICRYFTLIACSNLPLRFKALIKT